MAIKINKNKIWEPGSFTIEAILTLVIFVFAIMLFLTFGRYFSRQNRVKHALNECALTMSARNYQISSINDVIDTLVGVDGEDVDNIVTDLNSFLSAIHEIAGVEYHPIETNLAPYSNKNNGLYPVYDPKKKAWVTSKDLTWTDAAIKDEISRYFAYYYIADIEFDELKNEGYDEIKKRLVKYGIKDFTIKGAIKKSSDLTDPEVNILSRSDLNIEITYKIDTGMNFLSIFNLNEPQFTDSVTMPLLS